MMNYNAKSHFPYSDDSEFYKLIIETANEGIWIMDERDNTVFFNQKIADFLGYEIDEMLGKSIFDFILPSELEESRTIIDHWKKNATTQQILRFVNVHGEDVFLSLNTNVIVKERRTLGVLAMATNVTEQRLQAEKLREDQLNYTSLFEDLPVPIWDEDFSGIKEYIDQKKREGIIDFKRYFSEHPDRLAECVGRLVVNDINQAVVELNQASSKEQVLNGFRELLTENSSKYAIEQLVAIAENRTHCEFEAELRTFGGTIRYVHFQWTVVKGHEQTYKRVFLSTTDLTERIIIENLALQHSNREKAVLLKEIHHRVKNNLQIITSLLNLQSHSIEDQGMRETFEMSLHRIKAMATVHEMLYRSNDFSGVNYREYLESIVNSLVDSTRGLQSEIHVNLEVEDLVLNINTSIPLGLLINELITNALKHGLINHPKGEIYLRMRSVNKTEFLLQIGDNGIGISPETNIFETETLGLQLVTSLVQQLSGTITLLQSEEPGTHYSISFFEQEAHQDDPISSQIA